MAGLQLSANVRGSSGYTPMAPAAAKAPSASSVGALSFGINSDGSPTKGTAAYGSVAVGILASIALVYLWWSLPR